MGELRESVDALVFEMTVAIEARGQAGSMGIEKGDDTGAKLYRSSRDKLHEMCDRYDSDMDKIRGNLAEIRRTIVVELEAQVKEKDTPSYRKVPRAPILGKLVEIVESDQ